MKTRANHTRRKSVRLVFIASLLTSGIVSAGPTPINISGTIFYCSNPAVPAHPVPNVMVTLSGDISLSTFTDGAGNYTFSVQPGGDYTVTPSKANLAPGSAGINAVDVLAVTQHILGIGTPLSGCRLIAADVTGDSLINVKDVIGIERFFLGLTTGIAHVGNYQFSPVSVHYSNPMNDQTGQNYDTLVFGDVASAFVHRPEDPPQTVADDDMSVSTPSGLNSNAGEVVATVSLPNVAVDAFVTNFIVEVTTTAIVATSKLVGFQGDFTFDERVVTFQNEPVQKAGLTSGNWNVFGNVLDGTGPIRTLRMSAYSNDFTPLSGSGTLFELKMIRVSKAAQGTQLIWAPSPDHFVFIDADLRRQKPGSAAPGSVTSLEKRK